MYRNDAMACEIQQRRLELLSFAYEKKMMSRHNPGFSHFETTWLLVIYESNN